MLGAPVTIDAARFGSFAHRCRNLWQNFAPPAHVTAEVDRVQRAKGLQVDHILDAGRYSTTVTHGDRHPFYPANRRDEPRSALPTLVAYPQSRAFRIKQSVEAGVCL